MTQFWFCSLWSCIDQSSACKSFASFSDFSASILAILLSHLLHGQPNQSLHNLTSKKGDWRWDQNNLCWPELLIVGRYQALVVNFYCYWKHYFDRHCREAILVFRSWKRKFVQKLAFLLWFCWCFWYFLKIHTYHLEDPAQWQKE